MAMTGSGLSAAIEAAIEGESGAPSNAAELKALCDAIGNAVVAYIQANAVVMVTGVQGGLGTASGTIE